MKNFSDVVSGKKKKRRKHDLQRKKMSNSGSNSSTTPRAVNRNKRKFKPKVNMFHKINNHSIINYLGAGIIGKFLQNPKLFGCFSVDRS